MLAINRKVLRDLWQLKTQLAAIGLVIGCGVAMFVLAWSMLASLKLTQERYYEQYRFGHVFAKLKRAPNSLANRIAQVPGVAEVQTRVVKDVTLDIQSVDEPAIGRLISLPHYSEAGLNRLHLRQGRFPSDRHADEVLTSEGFAQAHRLRPGDYVYAVINGRRQRLNIVGIALSPEYVYQIRGREVIPNDRAFGVFWMRRPELAAAFDMEGAFNDLVLYLSPGASEPQTIEQVDSLLSNYGGLGAFGREMQTSNRYVTNELRELRNMGYFAPVIFLLVAAFLLNIVLSRIIGIQREQIASLKAFGYTRTEIGLHYIKMTIAVVVLGVLLGIGAGLYLGHGMAAMYTNYFRFPVLQFELQLPVIAWAVVISMSAALLGVFFAVRRAVNLPPAAAMQPEAPSPYRPAVIERLGLARFASPTTRMIFRHLERRPMTTLLTILGLSMAVAVMVLGNHAADSIDSMLDFQFFEVQRYNVSLGFVEPTSSRALYELQHLPGVVQVEPMRGVAAKLSGRNRTRLQDIMALPAEPQLLRLIDRFGRRHFLPAEGLVLSTKLAELLDVDLGDEVEVAVLEGRRPMERVVVAGLIDDMIGTSAYLRIDRLQKMMRDGDTISGAFLAVESDRLPELYHKLKETPRVTSVTATQALIRSFRETFVRTILRMRAINLVFASIIACGVVYNSARIAVAERSRDLASLRVLGYTRAEISRILLGELGLLTLAAIPIGLALGYGLVVFTTWGYETELFRLPVVIYRQTYGLAALAVMTASIVSALIVRRRLDRLDLVSVLKAKE